MAHRLKYMKAKGYENGFKFTLMRTRLAQPLKIKKPTKFFVNSMSDYLKNKNIPRNIWLGVSVENKDSKYRIDYLRNIQATIRFISMEPLLEDLGELDLSNIHWVIVGGESGNKARPMNPEWVLSIHKKCVEQGVAFFFKQWGTWGSDGIKRAKKANGRLFLGKVWNEEPELAIV